MNVFVIDPISKSVSPFTFWSVPLSSLPAPKTWLP